MSYAQIPSDIKAYPQWINWKIETIIDKNGQSKQTKVPVRCGDARLASVNDPRDWSDFDTAVKVAAQRGDGFGIGFVFTKSDPFVGIDLDDAGDDEVTEAQQKLLITELNSYTEYSPSGNGWHVIVKASLPGQGKHPKHYGCFDNGRYFTFTGRVYHECLPIADRQDFIDKLYGEIGGSSDNKVEVIECEPETDTDAALIERASNAKNGEKFKRLYGGDWQTDYGNKSQSEADFALVNIIAFYSRNSDQIGRIFRTSALGQRDKAKKGSYVGKMVRRAADRREPRVDTAVGLNGPWFDARKVEPWQGKVPIEIEAKMPTGGAWPSNEQPYQPPTSTTTEGAAFMSLETVDPEPIEWLWPGYLARGKLHILAGSPGTGKTTIALSLIASLTSGCKLPDGHQAAPCEAIIWSAEDDLADTLVPRLIAAGADMKNIKAVIGCPKTDKNGKKVVKPFNPATDMEELSKGMEQFFNVGIIIIDPITSAVSGDGHNNTDVRKGLQPLVDLGLKHNVAILGISHFTKGTAGRDPTERVTGSVAFGALARMVFVAAKREDEADGGSHMFARSKSNIAPCRGGFAYDLIQCNLLPWNIEASLIQWGTKLEEGAKEMLARAENVDKEETDDTKTNTAIHFLKTVFRNGPISTNDLNQKAAEQGLKSRTLMSARKILGVKAEKSTGRDGGWTLSLPAAKQPNEPLQTPLDASWNK